MSLLLAAIAQIALGGVTPSPWLVPDALLVALVLALWRRQRPIVSIGSAAAAAGVMTVQWPWSAAALYGVAGALAWWLAVRSHADDRAAQTAVVALLETFLASAWCVIAGAWSLESLRLAAMRVALTTVCLPLMRWLLRRPAAE